MKTVFWTFWIAATLGLVASLSANNVPDLGARLKERKVKANNYLDVETQRIFAEGIDAVRNDKVMQTALKPMRPAPDFTLMDFRGTQVTLSDLYDDGPVVLIFYRGGWCPYCNIQLATMQESIEAFKKVGAFVVAISPDKPTEASETATDQDLDFYVLSDEGNVVAKSYGIVYELPQEVRNIFVERGLDLQERIGTEELPLSATFVINKEGQVVYTFLDADYTRRAEPRELLSIAKMWADKKKKR